MIPILPCTSLKPQDPYDIFKRLIDFILTCVLIGMALWFAYFKGYLDGKKAGEIKILKAVTRIMVGALDGAANK